MGTFTAQMLVGQSHTYDGGLINITHSLYLSENDRPAWLITPVDIPREKRKKQSKNLVWIPTLEHMLEDALVMIGLYVLKDEQLTNMANQYFRDSKSDFIELYQDISKEHLAELYKRARSIESSHKVMLSVFQGSSILKQLPVLKQYKNEFEVCKSVYVREFSMWNQQFEVRGELETFEDF